MCRLLVLCVLCVAAAAAPARLRLPQAMEDWTYAVPRGEKWLEAPLARRWWDLRFLSRASSVVHFDQLAPLFAKLDRGERIVVRIPHLLCCCCDGLGPSMPFIMSARCWELAPL